MTIYFEELFNEKINYITTIYSTYTYDATVGGMFELHNHQILLICTLDSKQTSSGALFSKEIPTAAQ